MAFAKYPVSGGGGSGDIVGPLSSVNNGVPLYNGTTGKLLKDLGVGSANQVLLTNGTTPSFGAVTNAYVDAAAAIAYSKLNLATSIVNADIATSAAIAYSKLAALTVSRALVSDGSGVVSVSAVTSTEVGYLSGVTSAIQTQLNARALDSAVVHIAGTETITGDKTFSASAITLNRGANTTGAIIVSGSAANGTYYIQFANGTRTWQVGTNIDLGSTQSLQFWDVNGGAARASLTTAGQLQLPATSSQLRFGTTNTTTLSSTAPSASRVYTLPDAGADASIVLTAGTQVIGGTLTLPATVSYTSQGSIVKSGAFAHTLTTTATSNSTFPAGTQTLAAIGLAQTFSALQTFSDGLAISGGTAATTRLTVSGTTWTIGNGPTITEAGAAVFATSVTSPSFLSTAAQTVQSVTTQTLNAGTSFTLNVANATTPVAAIAAAANAALTFGPSTGSSSLTHTFQSGNSVTLNVTPQNTNQNGILNLNGKGTGRGYIIFGSDGTLKQEISVDSTGTLRIDDNVSVFLLMSNAGAFTFGASGGTALHSINTAALTTSTAAGVSYLRININGATRRIPTYNDA